MVRAATDVTALVNADQGFTRLFQASPAPFLVVKPDAPRFTIVEVNDAYLAATMRKRDEVVGRGIFEAFPDNPDDATIAGVSSLRASLERVLATRQPDTLPGLKYDIARPDGTFEERWWSPVNSVVLDENGEVEAIIHNANDVTEQRRAEAALRESEEKYRTLFDSMEQGFCIIEKIETPAGQPSDYRYVTANPAFERHSRLQNVVGKTIRELVPGAESAIMDIYDRVWRTRTPQSFEGYVSALELWMEAEVVPATQPNQLAVLFSDVSVRKHSELVRRESEERQAFLLRFGDALRAAADSHATMSIAAELFARHLDLSVAHYLLMHGDGDSFDISGAYADGRLAVAVGMTSGRLSDHGPGWGEQLRNGEAIFSDDHADRPEADAVPSAGFGIRSGSAVPLIRHGRLVAVLSTAHPAPRRWTESEKTLQREVAERTWAAVERARAEAALRVATAVAEAANQAKSDFLAAMSHELRTPLNAIAGHTQLLEMGLHGEVNAAQRDALARIQRSEAHLLALVNDVLNFAKLEAGRVEYDVEDVLLADVVADAFAIVEPQLAAKRIAHRVSIEPGAMARADREKLGQILLNLFSNAVKFTGSGGTVSVDLGERAGSPPGFIFLRITDTGIGIAREKEEAVFDPFVQVHRKLTRTMEGTGLGLAISRDLARGMGGDLRVRSRMGEGSTFTLTLPCVAAVGPG